MFQQRQLNEVSPLTEVSFCVSTPGTVASGTTVVYAAVACTVGGAYASTNSPATFALGDQLEVFPSAAAATNGLLVSAAPTATPGTVGLYFQNSTGSSVTPVAGAKYTIVATRITNAVV